MSAEFSAFRLALDASFLLLTAKMGTNCFFFYEKILKKTNILAFLSTFAHII